MSLLDALGTAAGAVGTGIEDAAKWAYNQSPAVQEAKNRQAEDRRQQNTAAATDRRENDTAYYRALNEGWQDVPAQQQPTAPVPAGRPTLKTAPNASDTDASVPGSAGTTSAAPSIASGRIKQIGGRAMYKPTDAETGKAFVPAGQLGDALRSAGWDGKTPVTPEQSHSVMQALNEAQPKDEPYEYDNSGKYIDVKTGNPVPGFIGRKTKKFYPIDLSGDSPQQSSPGAAPGGPFDTSARDAPRMFDQTGQNLPGTSTPPQSGGAASSGAASVPSAGVTFAPPQKAEKPDVTQMVPGQVGPHGGPLIFDKTTQSMREIPPVAGSRQTMTAAQTEADKDRHLAADRLAEDRSARLSAADQKRLDDARKAKDAVQAKHDKFQDAEQDQWDLHKRFADLANPTLHPNGATVNIPTYNARTGEISDGAQRAMSDQLRSTMIDQANEAQRKALEQQGYAAGIRKAMGWGEFAKPNAAAAAAGATEAPAQAPVQRSAAPAAQAQKQTAPQLPTGHKPGDTVTLRSGRQVKIKQVYSDGTFDY